MLLTNLKLIMLKAKQMLIPIAMCSSVIMFTTYTILLC